MRESWVRESPQHFVAAGGRVRAAARRRAARIVDDVRRGGEASLRRWCERLGDLAPGAPLLVPRRGLEAARRALAPAAARRLERVARRIRRFAEAQRRAVRDLDVAVEGGRAGHRTVAVPVAGCYAPGGRYPLPSSVLMTAVTARAAGVRSIWVASPRPTPLTLAAAAIAGARGVLAVGGAQAVAALALGVGIDEPCAVVAGPGNVYVTAAKLALAGDVAFDLPAGPSDVLVVADASADAEWIAADLLAQAEHDPLARPMLLALDGSLVEAVADALRRRLRALPTRRVAARALRAGGLCRCPDRASAARWVDRIAPEHLHLAVRRPRRLLASCRHYGAAFLGCEGGVVFGDYGAGPNHVLPTGGTAGAFAGLSVLAFLRWRTWLELERVPRRLAEDTVWMAEQEGLIGHAAAAAARLNRVASPPSPARRSRRSSPRRREA